MLADAATAEQDPPLVLTMAAVDRLSRLVDDADDTPALVRIEADGDDTNRTFRFGLEEQAQSDDVVLDFVRISVLLDTETHQMLRGFEVDHRDDGQGERFVIRRAE